jgi:hypothetical protein
MDGIHAARMFIGKCWFNIDKCARGLECLKNYERKWDAKNKVFSTHPLHNWSSHGADGFRTLALGFREDGSRVSKLELPRRAETDYDIFGS